MYQKRNPIIFIALFFLVVSCSTETKRVEVDTNTTIRVQSETFTSNPDNYNFNWIPPSLEQGSYHYDIKDNIMLLIQTDFPDPVVPATNKWGIDAKSPTSGVPDMLLPSAIGRFISFF